MPEVALIAPQAYLSFIRTRQYQMVLAGEYGKSNEYAQFYDTLQYGADPFIIVDNGAAEGVSVSIPRLFEIAMRVHAREIVVPDVLRDQEASYKLLLDFMLDYERIAADDQFWPRIMIPIHAGAGILGEFRSAHAYMQAVMKEFSDHEDHITLGLPRDLLTTINLRARLDLAQLAHQQWPDTPIHLLGANVRWPDEVAADDAQVARSIDTSLPFVQAAAGLRVHPDSRYTESRQENFFAVTSLDTRLLSMNIRIFDAWADSKF